MGFGLGIVELVSTGGGLVDFSKCLFFFLKKKKKDILLRFCEGASVAALMEAPSETTVDLTALASPLLFLSPFLPLSLYLSYPVPTHT